MITGWWYVVQLKVSKRSYQVRYLQVGIQLASSLPFLIVWIEHSASVRAFLTLFFTDRTHSERKERKTVQSKEAPGEAIFETIL